MEELHNFNEEQIRSLNSLSSVLEKYQEIPNIDEFLWNIISMFQGYRFFTVKGLDFTYSIKGGEIFVSRKYKSITKSSVIIAFHRTLELNRIVSGPKKLGSFGASYIYSIFVKLGIIKT